MVTESKSSVVKVKGSSNNQVGSSSKPKNDSSVIKRKVIQISSGDSKAKSDIKTEVKGKTTSTSSKTVTKTQTKTRVKKVYSLAGQKYDVPEEREPLRLFYESLSKQIPSSEMAEFWLMEHGLLSPERSKKAFEKKQRKQKQIRMGTPIKSPPPRPLTNKAESSKKQQQVSKNGDMKAKKRLKSDSSEDDDDDFILSPKRRKGLPMEQLKVQIDQMVNQLKQRSFSESSSVDLLEMIGKLEQAKSYLLAEATRVGLHQLALREPSDRMKQTMEMSKTEKKRHVNISIPNEVVVKILQRVPCQDFKLALDFASKLILLHDAAAALD